MYRNFVTTEALPTTEGRADRAGRPTDQELTTRILQAGAELLHEHGFAALSVEQVARDVGCGKAAIYRRFPGKPALVAAIIESRTIVGDPPDTGSLREDLLVHAQQNQQSQDGFGIGTGLGMHAIFEPEVYQLLQKSVFLRRRARGLSIIARGVARGELPRDTDATMILDVLAGLTVYRQSIKGIRIDAAHYLSVIDALLSHPPRQLTGEDEPSR